MSVWLPVACVGPCVRGSVCVAVALARPPPCVPPGCALPYAFKLENRLCVALIRKMDSQLIVVHSLHTDTSAPLAMPVLAAWRRRFFGLGRFNYRNLSYK